MSWVHSGIAAKILAAPQEQVAACLARIATVWMVDPRHPDRLVSSKELGPDEISAVTEAFAEMGMWPSDSGEFEDELPPNIIQESLDLPIKGI